MNYEQYSANDFAADEYFVKWVKEPSPQMILFWEQWLVEHPEKNDVVEEARQMVLSIQFEDRADTSERVQAILDRIHVTTHSIKQVRQPSKNLTLWPFLSSWQKIAASLIGILMVSALIFLLVFGG